MRRIRNTLKKDCSKIERTKNVLRITKYALTMSAVLLTSFATPVLADDPLAAISGLSDFIFSAIKAIGMILLGFGIVQIGLSRVPYIFRRNRNCVRQGHIGFNNVNTYQLKPRFLLKRNLGLREVSSLFTSCSIAKRSFA